MDQQPDRTSDAPKAATASPSREPEASASAPQEIQPPTDSSTSSASEEAANMKVPTESKLDTLQRDRDQMESKYLRVSADYQNFVRRSQQNIDTAREQQLMSMAKSLITVLDHFDRALEVDPAKTTCGNLIAGVQIVRDELLKSLEQFGVRRLEVSPGDVFDPTQHEALMREPAHDIEPNHVATQLQPGYTLGEKTLRPAQVSVTEVPDAESPNDA